MKRKQCLLPFGVAVFLFFTFFGHGQADILDAQFISGSEGFSYKDDLFGTVNPDWALGNLDPQGGFQDGGLRVYLGADPKGLPASGGWTTSVVVDKDILSARLSFHYRLVGGAISDPAGYRELLLTIDDVRYGYMDNRSIEHVDIVSAEKGVDTGWRQIDFPLSLEAGVQTICVGVYSSGGSAQTGWVEIYIDDVSIAPVNSPPVVVDAAFEITAGSSLRDKFAASDPDGDDLTYEIETQGLLGFARVANPAIGEFIYEPQDF